MLSIVVIDATRPTAFLAHSVVVVVVVFLSSSASPTGSSTRSLLSSAVALGEAAARSFEFAAADIASDVGDLDQRISGRRRSLFRLPGSSTPTAGKAHAAGVKEKAIKKKKKNRLQQAKEQWEETFYTVPDFVAILDDQHRIVRANRPMAERLGVTAEQCIGLHCYEAVHGTAEAARVLPARANLPGRPGTYRGGARAGPGRTLSGQHDPPVRRARPVIGSVHVARDITAQAR